MSHGVIIGDDKGKLTQQQALILIGEAIWTQFVKDFTQLWQELFADCKIKDYEATPEDWKRWLGSDYKNSSQ